VDKAVVRLGRVNVKTFVAGVKTGSGIKAKSLAVRFAGLALVMLAGALGAHAQASDVYITPDGSPQGACNGSPQLPTWFNNSANWGTGAGQIGPGTTVHICGTFTESANTTVFQFQGSGTGVNSQITLLFESGAILQAPYFAAPGNGGSCGGAICFGKRSWITIDGGSNGVIQNTGNGSQLGNKRGSNAIDGTVANNITVQNLTIANMYVNTQGDGSLGDSSTVRAINFNGSNWLIKNNTIHDCGWCIVDFYNNGDSNVEISGNDISNFGHAMAVATSGANALTTVRIHDNQVHDTSNWSAPGCPFHNDGVHFFGTSGSSIDQVFYYNNYNYGNWGSCPTGFVFVEAAGSGTPSNLKTSRWWNNVFVVPAGSPVDSSGWFEMDQGASGTQTVVNNTFIGSGSADNTLCMQVQGVSSLTFENNAISGCGDPVEISSSTIVSVDYNFYGSNISGNSFIWNHAFKGALAAWKSACACDQHSIQSNNPLLSANGAPMAGSPVIGASQDNLLGLATGSMSALASDTSLGRTRTPVQRPGAASAWDIGAFAYGTSTATQVAAPSGLQAAVQ
jgi:hypothetical protein